MSSLLMLDEIRRNTPVNGRIWLADLTHTGQGIPAETIPYGIGLVAAYAEDRLSLQTPVRLFKYPEKLAAALEAEGPPDVVGFSYFVWNAALSRDFARLIKELSPRTVVVFGGQNYPLPADEREEFLLAHPEIDFFVVEEGEVPFSELLQRLLENGLSKRGIHGAIRSVHSVAEDGKVHQPEVEPRMLDLDSIPSPYTNGKLDEFFDGKLVPLILTNRGCPFRCTFCAQGTRQYDRVVKRSKSRVEEEINYIAGKMTVSKRKGGRNDLLLADSNFGMIPQDVETAKFLAKTRETFGWPDYINVATGKNKKERVLEVAKILGSAMRLSGSVQSLDPTVLANIERSNISTAVLMELPKFARESDTNAYSEVILNLPGDSAQRHSEALRTLTEAGFNMIFSHQLQMLPGTELATRESKQRFGLKTRFRVYPRCFSKYSVCGRDIISVEEEEVCIEQDSMPFADYLDSRLLDMIVFVFFNNGIFSSLLKFLQLHEVSVFDWIETLWALMKGENRPRFADEFLKATESELYPTRQAFQAFASAPGTIDRLLAGEVGFNLLSTFKAMSITSHVDELIDICRAGFVRTLEKHGLATDANLEFLDDALKFHKSQMTNIVRNFDAPVAEMFRFDIGAFLESDGTKPMSAFAFSEPTVVNFVLTDEQAARVTSFLRVYTDSPIGIGRLMNRVYVNKLYRKAEVTVLI